jgi:hypothetical protein
MKAQRKLPARRLYVACSTIFVALLTTACPKRSGDNLAYGHLRRLAGQGSTDCGHVALGEDSTTANNCAVGAFQKKHPFIVRYEVQGRDSQLVVGLATNDHGQVVVVKYDSEAGIRISFARTTDSLTTIMSYSNHVRCPPSSVRQSADTFPALNEREPGLFSLDFTSLNPS